jgi:hypothetical protein
MNPEHTATASSRRSAGAARLVASPRGGGSGARSSKVGRRTPALRLIGLLTLALAALLALASSASAFDTHAFKQSFGSAGHGDGQFELATNSGLAVNETTHNVYLADTNNHRVDVFSETGTFIRAFGADVGGAGVNVCTSGCAVGTSASAAGAFKAPTFIAVDNAPGGEGDVYVADTEANLVSKFEADGTLIASWGLGGQLSEGGGEAFTSLRGLAVDSAGNLDLIENEPQRLFRFEQGGTFLAAVETPRENFAAGLAVDPSGDLFKANGSPTVEKFEAHAPPNDIGQVSKTGATGLAVDSSSGQLYVDNGPSIDNYTFNGSGEVIERPSSTCVIEPSVGCDPTSSFGSGKLTAAAGLAVDGSTHNVFAADHGAAKIVVFAPLTLPDATTEAATAITRQTATLNGLVGAGGGPAATCVFQYETEAEFQANPESERFEAATTAPCNPAGPFTGSGTTAVSTALSGLSVETTYRFRVLATNSESHSNPGEALSFTTTPAVTLTTGEATAITGDSATLNGEITPEGALLEACSFEYQDDSAFQENLDHGRPGFEGAASEACAESPAEIGSGNAPVEVHADLSSLNGGGTYHFRLAARNSFGENKGADASFLTLGPSLISESVSNITATSATLETELNPRALPTTYRFEYDTTPYAEGEAPHGTATPIGSAGSGTTNVARTAQIQGLAPLTTYHYRVVAENSLGTSEGEDRTFTTQGPGSALLPDDRAWEMVTPPNKHGAPLEPLTEEGGLIQAPATCTPSDCAFASVALGPLSGESQGVRSPHDAQWLSRRGPGSWSTEDITTAHEEISPIRVGVPSEYRFFSEDLSSSAVEPEGATPLSPQTSERTPYRREADGEFVPLVTADNVPAGTKFGGEEDIEGHWAHGVEFRTASPDLSHIVLESPQLLTKEFDPLFEANGRPNLYELSAGKLTLVSVLPGGETASEAGLSVGVGQNDINMRGAISADGRRVVFEINPFEDLYLRDASLGQTVRLDELQEEAAGGLGLAKFQAASADGSRVFFTDESRLTADSTAEPASPDLYMCEVSVHEGQLQCSLSDLTTNHVDPSEAADVQGEVSAIDAAGKHVYFTADGVLTTAPNLAGEVAAPADCRNEGEATCNLYVADALSHQIRLVAVLSSRDDPVWQGPTSTHRLGNLTARSSPNGRYFTFMSLRPLTGYDNRDAVSGRRDEEVFLYDTTAGELSCVSCNPTGARPYGLFDKEAFPGPLVDRPVSWGGRWLAASIPGWTLQHVNFANYQSRYLNDQGRLFFNAADALLPADTNGVMDVYQFEPPGVGDCSQSKPTYSPTSGGCVSLISSGTSPEESAFLDATESGDDVFFLTASKLAAKDTDSALDVYDAAVGGGEPEVVKPVECAGDACQQPAVPPSEPTVSTSVPSGPGNLLQCPKGKVKKSGKCVARKHHKAKHKRKGKKARRTASHNRGGQK